MLGFNGNSGKNYRVQGSPLASGGEGEIFNIIGMPDYVAKIFRYDKRTTERERKLSVMVSIRPNMIEQYSWPVDVLYENGKFAGYIMPKIQGKEKLRDIYVFDKRQGKPWSLYIAVAKNVAAAVHNVHEIHQVIGDLNPENILVNPNDGMVTLVDTDSYHISDSRRTYRCEVGMPEYVAPELQGVHFPSASLPTFTEETDRFSLAVLIFALLMNGAHPFACKILSGSSSKFQPIDNMQKGYCAFFQETCAGNMDVPKYAPTIDCLPDDIQKLFRRAFVSGRTNTSVRPSAEEWYFALERLENNLKTCLNNDHHFYYYCAKDCPWCQVTKKMHTISQSAFSSSSISAASSNVQTQSVYRPSTIQTQYQQQHIYSNNTPNTGGSNTLHKKYVVVAVTVFLFVIIFAFFNFNSIFGSHNSGSFSNDKSFSSNITNSDSKISNSFIDSSEQYKHESSQPTESKNDVIDSKISDSNNNEESILYFEKSEVSKTGIEESSLKNDSFIDEQSKIPVEVPEHQTSYSTVDISKISPKTINIDSIEQKEVTIEGASFLQYSGEINEKSQKDSYNFKTQYKGRYRIDLSGLKSGTYVKLYFYDALGNRIGADNACTNGEGITVKDLNENSTYTIEIIQYQGYSPYFIRVGLQKSTTDISGITELKDSVEYKDQRNVYKFKVPITGRYRFDMSGMMNGTAVHLVIYNNLYEILGEDKACSDGEGVTVKDLKAGEVYEIQVRQYSGISNYTLNIGCQKETTDITGITLIKDSVEYKDQRNVYKFKVPITGRYRFDMSGMMNGTAVHLVVYNNLYEILGEDKACSNGEGVTVKDLKAGEVYEIQVRQYCQFSDYKLSVGYQKESVEIDRYEIINDSIEYTDQRNVYLLCPIETTDITFKLTGMNSDMGVKFYIFDELGQVIVEDFFQNNESVTVKNITGEKKYEIQIRYYTNFGNYSLTVS